MPYMQQDSLQYLVWFEITAGWT